MQKQVASDKSHSSLLFNLRFEITSMSFIYRLGVSSQRKERKSEASPLKMLNESTIKECNQNRCVH